jgi:hypothetical protein
VAISGEIFIDNNQINHIANTVFTNNGTAVRGITMDGFMEENHIDFVGLLKASIKGAERLSLIPLKNFRE